MDVPSQVAKNIQHDELCARIEAYITAPNRTYLLRYKTKILAPIKAGQYNLALRRLCSESHRTIDANHLIGVMMAYQVPLEINAREKNTDGLSALDYAAQYNPSAVNLIKRRENRNVVNVTAPRIPEMAKSVEKLAPRQLDGLAASLAAVSQQPSESSGMRPDQAAALQSSFQNVLGLLQSELSNFNPNESEAARMQRINSAVMKTMAPPTAPTSHLSPDEIKEKILVALTQFISMKSAQHPARRFLELYQRGEYESAMRHAATMNDENVRAIFEVFFPYRESLPFNMDTMLDAQGRTPLHAAAAAGNMQAYYAMAGYCNSGIADLQGITAADLRRSHQARNIDRSDPLASLLASINPEEDVSPGSRGPQ